MLRRIVNTNLRDDKAEFYDLTEKLLSSSIVSLLFVVLFIVLLFYNFPYLDIALLLSLQSQGDHT